MKIYDISRPICAQTAVWPGDQAFASRWTLRRAAGDACNVSAITMSVHVGTHADAPYHFDERGLSIERAALENYLGPAWVFEVPPDSACVRLADVRVLDTRRVKRLLIKTPASQLPESVWRDDFLYVTTAAAQWLGEHGLLLLGTDAPSVDRYRSKTLSAHRALAAHGVAILENLNLRGVQPGEYDLIALPLRFAGLDASPLRAILLKRD